MFLSDLALKKPIATLVGLIILGMFGVLAMRNVGVDIVPSVTIPYVSVQVIYPGASPDEMETAVVRKIEDAAVQVDGIKHITSTCGNNFSLTMLEFELGRDLDVMATDVREKIALIEKDLPAGAEKPKVMKFDINATAVVTMALTGSQTTEELYDYADDRLKDRFASLGGVATVDLIGGEKREVVVTVDRDKLAASGLTLAQVIEKVGKGNLKLPSGSISDHGREFSVMFNAEAKEIARLGDIELGSPRGDRVYLRDVASFNWGTARAESLAYFDGKPAIVLKVTKKGEANAAAVVDAVKGVYEQLCGQMPEGMTLNWVRDDGAYVKATVMGGIDAIWQGILLTGFILLIFLADWRTALTAFVSIPATIVIAMVTFSVFGYTMNLSTMTGVGISTGILVANSIVVLENIAAKPGDVGKATGEIALAVFASALTNVVVFIPIATMRTLAGQFFVPFAVTVTIATLSSLLISFTLTPMMAQALMGKGEVLNRFLARILKPWDLFYRGMEKFYLATVREVTRHPKTWLLLFSAATLAGFALLVPFVKSDFTPNMDQGDISVTLEFAADSTLERTAERTREIAKRIAALTDSTGGSIAERVTISIGKVQGTLGRVSRGTQLAQIDLKLRSMTEREDSINEIATRIRAILRDEPDVMASALIPLIIGGTSQKIQLRVLGDDLDKLNEIGLGASKNLKGDPSAANVVNTVRAGRPEIRIAPNRAVINDLGLTPYFLGLNLRAAIAGIKSGTYTAGDRAYDIRVRYDERDGAEQIEELNFPGPEGRPFTLGAVAEVHKTLQPVTIVRSEKRRAVFIDADNAPVHGLSETLATGMKCVNELKPRDYEIVIGGQAEYMHEALSEFKLVTFVAIALTFLLLAAMLESWTMPFIILFTIPFSYLGIFAATVLTHTTLSIFGLLAGIMLVGVVVNAAILYIDEWQRTGDVMQAAKAKFRPILMSCAAALFGMMPMALGGGLGCELRQSMGIGSVGGMLVSTLISLYFIPALCALRR